MTNYMEAQVKTNYMEDLVLTDYMETQERII